MCSRKSDELHDDLVALLALSQVALVRFSFVLPRPRYLFVTMFPMRDSCATSSVEMVKRRIIDIIPIRTYDAGQILPSDLAVQQIGV